jgi:hypothetical protein
MAEQIYFDGPRPPAGHIWCAICAGMYKQAGIDAQPLQLEQAKQDGGRISLRDHTQELNVAVTRALSILGAQFGILDVCWSHAMALTLRMDGITPASPQEAAMLSQAVPLRGGRK